MALTFPLAIEAFAEKLPIVSAPFVMEEQQQLSGLGSGDVLAAQLAPSRWTVEVTLASMRHTSARGIQSLIESLNGPMQSFYLYCPTNCYPAADPGGVILGSASAAIHTIGANNRSLRLSGLPSGYVITFGDALAFDYAGGRRAWHRIAETVTADAAGVTPLFDVSHHLRPGAVAGLAVNLKKPAAKMFRSPELLSVSHTASHSTISFKAIQRP